MSEIAGRLFNGPGMVIVQLLALALGTWVAEYVAQAIGKPQLAQLMKLTAVFVAMVLMINSLWKAIDAVAVVMGLK
jgi:hypothetical protein